MTGSFNHRYENMPPHDDEDLLERLPTIIPNMQAAFNATATYAASREECTYNETRHPPRKGRNMGAIATQSFTIPLETGIVLRGAQRISLHGSHTGTILLAKPAPKPGYSLTHRLRITAYEGRNFALGSERRALPSSPMDLPELDPQHMSHMLLDYGIAGAFSGSRGREQISNMYTGTRDVQTLASWPETFTTDEERHLYAENGPVGAIFCQIREDMDLLKGLGGVAGFQFHF